MKGVFWLLLVLGICLVLFKFAVLSPFDLSMPTNPVVPVISTPTHPTRLPAFSLPQAGLAGTVTQPDFVRLDVPARFAGLAEAHGMTPLQALALRYTRNLSQICAHIVEPGETLRTWADCAWLQAASRQVVLGYRVQHSDEGFTVLRQALVATPSPQFPVAVFSYVATAKTSTPGQDGDPRLQARVLNSAQEKRFTAFLAAIRPAQVLAPLPEWKAYQSKQLGVVFDIPQGVAVTEDQEGIKIFDHFSLIRSTKDPRAMYEDSYENCVSFLKNDVQIAGKKGNQFVCIQLQNGRREFRKDQTEIVLRHQDVYYHIRADDVFTTLRDVEDQLVLDRVLGSLRWF